MTDRKKLARKLVLFAKERLGLGKLDSIYAENVILAWLHEPSPCQVRP